MNNDKRLNGIIGDAEDRVKDGEKHHHPHGSFEILIKGESQDEISVTFGEPNPSGRQILSKAGFVPEEDHALIQLLLPGSRLIDMNDKVDLRNMGRLVFRVFGGGEIFLFTVDDTGYQWGASKINEADLRDAAVVPEEKVLVLERDGEEAEVPAGGDIELSHTGVEHLRTRHGMITVTLDGDEKRIHPGMYTTEKLIQVLGVEAGYLLNVVEDGELIPLQPNEKLRVKDGMIFISQVPSGGSS